MYMKFICDPDEQTLEIKIFQTSNNEYFDSAKIFWQKQHRGQCGQHSVNNVVQSKRFTYENMKSFAAKVGYPVEDDTNKNDGFWNCALVAALYFDTTEPLKQGWKFIESHRSPRDDTMEYNI